MPGSFLPDASAALRALPGASPSASPTPAAHLETSDPTVRPLWQVPVLLTTENIFENPIFQVSPIFPERKPNFIYFSC